jgi:hypothetical protein
MKKVLFILGLVLSFTTMEAKSTYDLPTTNRYNQRTLQFVARDVEFVVFKNGEFDFNTHPMRRSRRRGVNGTYGAPRTHSTYRSPARGVRIEHDYYGRVRCIGSTFINYDSRGRVKRIGSVYMSYNRRGLLRQLGGLHIYYTPYGRIAYTRGRIKHHAVHNDGYNSGEDTWDTYGENSWQDFEWQEDSPINTDDDYEEEDDMYYFKQSPKDNNKKKKLRKRKG